MIIFDTDVFSLLELPDSPEFLRIRNRLMQTQPAEPAATTVITYEEQSRGRLAMVASARTPRNLALAYSHLHRHILNYRRVRILDFDDAASEIAGSLQRMKLRMGTMDIRIAAIALVRDATLVTRNVRDFERVPNLRVEDWTRA